MLRAFCQYIPGIVLPLMLLAGCKFEAERDILSDHQPSLSLAETLASLPANRYEEMDGQRAVSIEMEESGHLRLILFDEGVEKQSLSLSALYEVPGPSNAVLATEIQASGRAHYYLLRRHEDGSIEYVDVDTATHHDPRILLYRANLWAMGIAQMTKIVDFGDESGRFRPSTQSAADFDAALTTRQQQHAMTTSNDRRQSCMRMMAECSFDNTVCVTEGDEVIVNSLDGSFWYAARTGELKGLSGVGLLGSGRPNCAIFDLVD